MNKHVDLYPSPLQWNESNRLIHRTKNEQDWPHEMPHDNGYFYTTKPHYRWQCRKHKPDRTLKVIRVK